MTDQERERVAVLFCMNDATHKRCEDYNCVNCNNPDGKYFTFADIHLKEVEKARAEGMKKAAEEIKKELDYYDDVEGKWELLKTPAARNFHAGKAEGLRFAFNVLTTANKTLEAEGDESYEK